MNDAEQPDQEEPKAAQTAQDRDSKPWLSMIIDAERCFESYQKRADNVDKEFGNLNNLASGGEREMQMFWANLEVLKPAIYAREPIPVVMSRSRDRKPVPRKAAEILERALIINIEMADLHSVLKMVRDDLATCARGVPWVSVQMRKQSPIVSVEHVERRDFLHQPARKWEECEWVARRVHLTQEKMLKRFRDTCDQCHNAGFTESGLGGDDEDENYKGQKTAPVWEIWHKTENVVVWVTDGVETVLDIQEPFMDLEGFFPCPRPAYGTIQRGTLIPIPDFLYYKDQIEEVNELTARISALMESLQVVGLYPAGQGDISEAIETALEMTSDKRVKLIGVPSLRELSAGSGGKLVEWWPVDQVVVAIREAIEQRRQLIEDIYQITGISDIMRGDTQASETATAQNLKSQFGGVRVRTRQEEMIRIARDVVRMMAEIMAEQFDAQTLLDMSQVDDAPTMAELQQAQAQQQPIDPDTVPIEPIMQLLNEQRMRPFVLDIETDSTIQPNEDAEKQRRTEFVATVGGLAQQAMPMVQQFPQSAELVVEILKFAAGGFRAGRDLEGAIEQFGEQAKQAAQQVQAQADKPSPEEQKLQVEAQAKQAEMQAKVQEAQARAQIEAAKLQFEQQRHEAEMAFKQKEFELKVAEWELRREQIAADFEMRERERASAAESKEDA